MTEHISRHITGRRSTDRDGFTLVELLIVITIIGILMALLLPAAQGVRESMRRATCKNNMRQFGIAALQHVEKHGYYPSSGWGFKWIGEPDAGFGKKQPGGWVFNCLPYMNLNTIHQVGAGIGGRTVEGMPTCSEDRRKALASQKSAVVPIFHCPSRRDSMGYPPDESSTNAITPPSVAKLDYGGCGGSNRADGWGAGPGYDCLNKYPNCGQSYPTRFNGLTYRLSEVKDAMVLDGSSRTIFAAEKYMNPAHYNVGNTCSDNNSAYQGFDWDVNRYVGTGADVKPRQDTPNVDSGCTYRFGSAHPSGFHAVMGDGSVNLLKYKINQNVFSNLGNRKDQNTDGDTHLN